MCLCVLCLLLGGEFPRPLSFVIVKGYPLSQLLALVNTHI